MRKVVEKITELPIERQSLTTAFSRCANGFIDRGANLLHVSSAYPAIQDVPVLVDENKGWKSADIPLSDNLASLVEDVWPEQLFAIKEVLQFSAIRIGANSEDHEILAGELLIKCLFARDLRHAKAARSVPEIKKNYLSSILFKRKGCAVDAGPARVDRLHADARAAFFIRVGG